MERLVATNKFGSVEYFNSMDEAVDFVTRNNVKLQSSKANSIANNIKVGLRGWEMKHGQQVPRLTAYGYKWSTEVIDDEVEADEPEMNEPDVDFVSEEENGSTVEVPEVLKTAEKYAKKHKGMFAKNFRQDQHDMLAEYDRENPPKNSLHMVCRALKRWYQGCGDLAFMN